MKINIENKFTSFVTQRATEDHRGATEIKSPCNSVSLCVLCVSS